MTLLNSFSCWSKRNFGIWTRCMMRVPASVPSCTTDLQHVILPCCLADAPLSCPGDFCQNLSTSKKVYNKMSMKTKRMFAVWAQKMSQQARFRGDQQALGLQQQLKLQQCMLVFSNSSQLPRPCRCRGTSGLDAQEVEGCA